MAKSQPKGADVKETPPVNDLSDYRVTQARDIGGTPRKVGDVVTISTRAAKYYVPPHGTGLEPVKDETTKAKAD